MLDGLEFLPLEKGQEGMQFLQVNTPEEIENLFSYLNITYVTSIFHKQLCSGFYFLSNPS